MEEPITIIFSLNHVFCHIVWRNLPFQNMKNTEPLYKVSTHQLPNPQSPTASTSLSSSLALHPDSNMQNSLACGYEQ